MDVVFDGVGGETRDRSWRLLKLGGRLVTIAADSEDTKDPQVKDAFFIVEPNQRQLTQIAGLLDDGKLRVFVDAQVPLAEAPIAYAGKAKRQQGHGKVVIVTPAYEQPRAGTMKA